MKRWMMTIANMVMLGGLVLAMSGCGVMVSKNMTTPELGYRDGQLKALPDKPNCVSSQAEDGEKRVDTLPYKGDREATMAALLSVLNESDNVEILSQESHYVHAVYTTSLMRFKDDVEFLLDDESQRVHFRSASRIGYSDFGVNRSRYHDLAAAYGAK